MSNPDAAWTCRELPLAEDIVRGDYIVKSKDHAKLVIELHKTLGDHKCTRGR